MDKFELKPEHVVLLRHASVRWEDCEFGAPAIDCKRPYGNSGVITDIREMFGYVGKECPHCGEIIPNENDPTDDELRKLHKETETALQVVLSSGSFEPGMYVCTDLGKSWTRDGE